MVETNTEMIEFTNTETRDVRVNGSKRLLVITHGSVVTRLVIQGIANGGNGGLFTISDVTVPTPLFEQFKGLILGSAK